MSTQESGLGKEGREPTIISKEKLDAAMEAAKSPERAAISFGTPAVEPVLRRGLLRRFFGRREAKSKGI